MIRLVDKSEMLASASLAHHARGIAVVLALWGTVSACGSPQSGAEPSPALDVTPVAPVEVVPVEPEYVPTAEELAAEAAAEANSAWERAATLIAESQPGERPYAEIVLLMEQVLQHDAGLPDAWFNIGLMRYEQGDRAGAAEAYRRAGELNPQYARGLANLAFMQLEDGDLQGALTTIQECLGRRESEPGCNINLSMMYRSTQIPPEGGDGTPDSAAIQRLRYGLLEDIDAEAYTQMAEIYQGIGQIELARLVCENAAQQGIVSASLYNRLGLLALEQQEVLRAYEAFRLAAELDGQYIDAFLNMGAMAFSFRDYPTAAGAFEHALLLRDDSDIRLSFGAALRGLEMYDEAQAQYDQVLGSNPDNLSALYNVAVLQQEGRQDYAMACGTFKRFLSNPSASGHESFDDVTRRLNNLFELASAMADFGEMDPAVVPACDPSLP
jgi:tetratricopeptide (TPR) repeat protein